MDILRVISASDLEVRRKTLDLAMDLVSSRNVEEVIEIKSCFYLNKLNSDVLFIFVSNKQGSINS